ncbi:MAG: S9 family peptidase [Gemmatimonadales bacterium]|nr:S9 family peptidase [Gemmatimonadales bacterium]
MDRRLLLTLLLLAPTQTSAQQADRADPSRVTVQRIYGSADFQPERFGPTRWLGDGSSYTTLEASPAGGRDIVRYDTETGARDMLIPASRLIPPGASAPLAIDDYHWGPGQRKLLVYTNSKQVWRLNTRGDYWVLDRASGRLSKLGGNAEPSTLMYAKFDPAGERVGYVRNNNIYVEDLATGAITQLTHDGTRTVINGNFDWVYEEELSLHDGWRWSPDGTRIAYWQLEADRVRDFLMYRTTDSLYSSMVPVQYPKAGEDNSAVRIGVVLATGGATRWLSIEGDPRNIYLARMEWAASSDELVVQRLNRLQNRLDLLLADARTGAVRTILTEQDSAWVEVVDDLVWLDGGKSFTWVSERDGWTKAYVVSRDGRQVRAITPGAYDVIGIRAIDERGGWLYFIASPDNPTQRYLYRTRLDGKGKLERVSPAGQQGTHGYNLSPDARWAIHTYSKFGTPPVMALVRLPEHRTVRTVVTNSRLAAQVDALRRGQASFERISIGGGVELDAWVMRPPGFDSTQRYPVLFSIYGGPGSQTVLDSWGGTNYLWHLSLTQRGVVVASVDNRGSGARGRDWRKIIYGRLGVIETQDQAAAARAFARKPWVDPTRMGIYGWSYGGFMSLNGLFQAPDVYSTAVSVAPVTHWKYYDTIYTERYNGLPQENAAGYDQGSPLSYVDGMKGNLLLVHGTGDDNVHYQNTEALIDALVAANKQFRLMSYPNRNHSISGGTTSVHLRTMISEYLVEKLTPSEPPPSRP